MSQRGWEKGLLNYTDSQIKKELESILETKEFSIKPVGNHHLKRHLVYEIQMVSGEKYVFKLYYRDRRRSREIASLKLLENSNIRCPKIVKSGNLKDGSEWLVISYIEGELLAKVMNNISLDNKVKIFEEMGEELGKLHSFKSFDFFGEWDETGRPIENIRNYYDSFVKDMEKEIKIIYSQQLPDMDLLNKGIKIIRDNYKILDINIESRLIHNDFDERNILVKEEDGVYRLSGIIDFEASYPGNAEKNFIQLYFKHFLYNEEYEKAFFKGYEKYLTVGSGFKDRLYIYLVYFSVENCSWAYVQAPDYYRDNIDFLNRLIN